MNKLTRMAVERPVTILMIILALVILGAQGYRSLKVDRYPSIVVPFVSVVTSWPGAAPVDVEQQVVKPVEDAVAGISGVDTIQSTASQGSGSTQIRFLQNVDSNQAATDVERAIGRIRGQLPSDAGEPSIIKADISAQSIMNITLSGPQTLEELFYSADQDITPRLLAVPGVAGVNVNGGLQPEVQVQIDPVKMRAFGLSLSKVQQVLTAENADIPAGTVTTGDNNIPVRSVGRFKNVEEIQNLIISTTPQRVQMKDLATVVETHKDIQQTLRLNGQQTVGLGITKQADANVIQTADGVRAALAKMQNVLPKGAKFTVVTDDSQFTRDSVNSVQTDLMLAVLITGVVLLAFLHMLRGTIIVLLAVPTSLISTFLIMFALGFSLDTLSLLALALTIGILVDDSIVVLENIIRHLDLGEKPQEAAVNGRSEIGMAAVAITLTDVVVYVPVAFMSGIIGQLFREYGITIATATMFSLFISFTLTPMLASRWFKRSEAKSGGIRGAFVNLWERGYTALANTYARSLRWTLHRRPLVLMVAGVALAVAVAFIPLHLLGVEYAPSEDDNVFTANLRMPAGTALDITDAATKQIEDIVKSEPEVTDILASVGGGGGGNSAGQAGSRLTVKLVDKRQRQRSVFEILNDVRQKARSVKGANIQFQTSGFIGTGFGAPLNVQVSGPDENVLTDLTNKIVDVMKTVPGVTDVRNADVERSPEIQAQLDRNRMNDLGISATEVGSALRTAIAGTQVSTLQRVGQPELDITLIAAANARNDPKSLAELPLKFTKNNTPITLGDIGQLGQDQAPAQIKRYNRVRSVSLSAGVAGRTSGDVAADVQKALDARLQLPQDYSLQLVGQTQQQATAFAALFSALTLSVVMIYMLMAALYESFLEPLVIMFSLPVAMVGAFSGLLLTGNTLNIFSLLGIIMLMGLVTKNAILLVDFTDILRSRGLPRNMALVEAGRLRLRPILMTTAAVVFAMIPFVLKLEPGAESRAPLAAAVMGGVISSTLLTLVLVPTAYTYLDTFEAFLRRRLFHMRPRYAERSVPETGGVSPAGAGGVTGEAGQPAYTGAGK